MRDLLDREIALIENEYVRGITRKTLEFAPEYFWTCSASQTGLYHPADELGEGGTVLHVRKAVKMGVDLCRAYEIVGLEKDYVVSALILHDICKYGYPTHSGLLVQGHGVLVGQVMKMAGLLEPDTPEQTVINILNLCATHMGRWDEPYSPLSQFPLLSKIVHLADYVVARKYVGVEV